MTCFFQIVLLSFQTFACRYQVTCMLSPEQEKTSIGSTFMLYFLINKIKSSQEIRTVCNVRIVYFHHHRRVCQSQAGFFLHEGINVETKLRYELKLKMEVKQNYLQSIFFDSIRSVFDSYENNIWHVLYLSLMKRLLHPFFLEASNYSIPGKLWHCSSRSNANTPPPKKKPIRFQAVCSVVSTTKCNIVLY